MTATDTRSELSARFDDLSMLGTMPLILRARLAWAHNWISTPALSAVFQMPPGTNFIVHAAARPHASAITALGAGLSIWNSALRVVRAMVEGSRAASLLHCNNYRG